VRDLQWVVQRGGARTAWAGTVFLKCSISHFGWRVQAEATKRGTWKTLARGLPSLEEAILVAQIWASSDHRLRFEDPPIPLKVWRRRQRKRRKWN
jgi:hypothetical protein